MKDDDLRSDPIRFASLIAHQLQSPLNAVRAALQSVLAEYTGPLLPQQRGTLEKANVRMGQAVTTIQRMLAIVRAAEEPGADPGSTSLVDALKVVQGQYATEADARGISLGLVTHVPQVYVRSRESALGEVLRALLENALKYTPDGGRVVLRTESFGDPGWVRLIVEDSGIGVPESEREHIFRPFHRSSTARASGQPGVGLGLAFVQSMLLASGGRVRVDRSVLGGAAFILEWPETQPPVEADRGSDRKTMRVVIIGGVTAGPKAAAKIIRLQPATDVTIVDQGSILAYAGCGLPYYVAGVVKDPKRLISSPAGVVRDPVFFRNVMNVHVKNRTEAIEIDRAGRRVQVRDSLSGHETWLPYDKLVLATGAQPVVPAALRTSLRNVFTLHGVRDAEGIRSALGENRARDVVIIGAGLIGVEMTEALVRKGARVTMLEQKPRIMPLLDEDMAILVERHLEANGVKVLTGREVRGLTGEGTVQGVTTQDGWHPADLVILAVGIRPQVDLARKAGLDLGATGAIRVDEQMRTSDPDIYAAGDCVEVRNLFTGKPGYMPLGSTASKQGRVVGANVCGGQETFPGVLNTSICKVFDYTVGRTGLGETEARDAGHDVMTVLVPGLDCAHYMPNARLILLKLVVEVGTRRLLGVQAVGPGRADKRIDVAATLIAGHMTLEQIANMDLSYAPPYSTDMDNLITAANVARNKLSGQMVGRKPAEVHQMIRDRAEFVLLDVRTPEEADQSRLQGSVVLPLGSLRSRMDELPRDQEIITYCDISLRAYEAARMLMTSGFNRVSVLEGGLAMWPYEKTE